ncbi:MAG: hypothetical protein GTO14_08100 [Anaerolineales bacterium]|nr:hypothetical protein [Anaerolineales bacterium]
MPDLNSRDRMLRTISLEEADHIPCCFMSFTALRKRCDEDFYELTKAELGMGFDSMLFIPSTPSHQRTEHPHLRGLPVRFHPEVQTREWREHVPGDSDVLHREYATPSGKLTRSVLISEDWPHGDLIPFVDDYQVPRSQKALVTQKDDLEALQFLLTPPHEEDVARFREEAQRAHQFVEEHGVLLAGGWGVGADMAFWLCGLQDFMIAMMIQREYAKALLEMIHQWNMERMKVVLSAPVDLYIRRAWYEGCDFITPQIYSELILPNLKDEVALAHEHDTRFGYICTSGINPMLEHFVDAGIDVLIGIDPLQGTHTDMPMIKEKVGEAICVWGGVSGALTVEQGTDEQVRAAVQEAIEVLGPTGFVLSPIDNITLDQPLTWHNLEIFLDEWRKHR